MSAARTKINGATPYIFPITCNFEPRHMDCLGFVRFPMNRPHVLR